MRIVLPSPPVTQPYLVDFVARLTGLFRSVVSKDESTNRILLADTNGVVWAVTVTTAGALTTAVLSGKVRDI
jgi:hypothetical protein